MIDGKRKLIFFLSLAIGLFVLKFNNVLGDTAFESCMWAVCLGFAGGNGAEHWAKRSQNGANYGH